MSDFADTSSLQSSIATAAGVSPSAVAIVVEAAGDRTKKFKLARPGLAQQYLACLELVLAARRGADAV